jgi:hypothetical protein
MPPLQAGFKTKKNAAFAPAYTLPGKSTYTCPRLDLEWYNPAGSFYNLFGIG